MVTSSQKMESADERVGFPSAVQDSHQADVGELEQLPESMSAL